jgi:Spy/CpxP family protein refolding chaperone
MIRKVAATVMSISLFFVLAGPGGTGGPGEHNPGGEKGGAHGGKAGGEFKREQQGGGGPGQAMKKLEAARALQLTPQQQTQLATLEREVRQQMVALRDEMKPQIQAGGAGGGDRRAMMQQFQPKIQAMQQQVTTGLNSILTPQQQAELNQKMQSAAALGGSGFTKQMRHEAGGDFGKQRAAGAGSASTTVAPAAVSTPVAATLTSQVPHTPDTSTSGGVAVVNPFTP